MDRQSGFTWVELVVVLVIVAIVACVLPMFTRPDHRGANCQSNMKQLGLGICQYIQDYDNRYPIAKYWASEVYPYEKSTGVYKCPLDPNTATATTYPVSYAVNKNMDRRKSSEIDDISVSVMACEFTSVSGNMTVPNDTASSAGTVGLDFGVGVWGNAQLGEKATAPTIHDPALMVLTADGHVKLLRPEKVAGGLNAASSKNRFRATPCAAAGTKAMESRILTFSIR